MVFFFFFNLLLFIVNLRDRFEILSDLTKKKQASKFIIRLKYHFINLLTYIPNERFPQKIYISQTKELSGLTKWWD